MADPTDPQSPADPDATPEPVVVEPVSAAGHVGVEPDVPVVSEVDETEVVDDVAEPVVIAEPVEPVEPEPLVEPDPYSAPVVAEPDTVVVDEVIEEEVVVEPELAPVAPEPAAPVPVVPVSEAPREVVYVQAPTPPRERGNRGFGVLISLLGTVAFALLYLAAAVVISLIPGSGFDASIPAFLASDAFWVPVAAYAVFSVMFALIINRAAWWAHVIGSIFVAVLTYAVSLGVLALLRNVVAMTPDEAAALFAAIAFRPPLLIAALVVARETALWFGLAIASRGRRVKERNAVARAEFEQSVADQRAEYERAHAS